MSRITVADSLALEGEREIAFYFKDEHLGHDYPVYKARTDAFWMKDSTKVDLLFSCFKRRMLVKQACYACSISYDEFRNFALIHPWTYHVIRVYKKLLAMRLMDIAATAALGGQELPCEMCHATGTFKGNPCVVCKGTG
ncbi:MAG: hypothetical protein ACREHG_00595, partial [Candidatus Saccharimonadales bacterium]